METHFKKSHFLILICLLLVSALCIWNIGVEGQKEIKLPKVISKAKSIEVLGVKLEGQETLVVSLRNNSEKPVIAITLESGNAKDSDGVAAVGYKENDEPDSIIIRPHETYDMDMPLSYLRPGGLVKVSGVIYADGTEEGDKGTTEMMRKQKTHLKRKEEGPQR